MDYQPRGGKKGRFTLRKNTYRRTWYLIADYPYFKSIEYDKNAKQYEQYIKAIEDARTQIPEAYADFIMLHIIERKKYKDMVGVSERTLKLWTQRFIWHVANNMGEA